MDQPQVNIFIFADNTVDNLSLADGSNFKFYSCEAQFVSCHFKITDNIPAFSDTGFTWWLSQVVHDDISITNFAWQIQMFLENLFT